MAKKWRECTTIMDYEFDPDGKYDGSLGKEDWDEIFNELYQRAETTEEYLYNDWVDPQSVRNAYTEYFKKGGEDYIVLKYYDGMYALYEIKDEKDILENVHKTSGIIEKLEAGVSVRQAILEAVTGKSGVFEDVSGMDRETYDDLLSQMDKWTGGTGKNGWEYETIESNNGQTFVIQVNKNPITDFRFPVSIDKAGSVLNGEIYYKDKDEYLAASGPVSFAGLKSVLRDIMSQIEMVNGSDEQGEKSEDIYGY